MLLFKTSFLVRQYGPLNTMMAKKKSPKMHINLELHSILVAMLEFSHIELSDTILNGRSKFTIIENLYKGTACIASLVI